jgi:hypothetical protein
MALQDGRKYEKAETCAVRSAFHSRAKTQEPTGLKVEIQVDTPVIATVPAATIPRPVVAIDKPAITHKKPLPLEAVVITIKSPVAVTIEAAVIKAAIIAVAIKPTVVTITVPPPVTITIPVPISVAVTMTVTITMPVFKPPVMVAIKMLGRGQSGAACNQSGSNRQYP